MMSFSFQVSLNVESSEDWMTIVGKTVAERGVFTRHEKKIAKEQVIF